MKFNLSISHILILTYGLILFSCQIETARPAKKQKITIVSDYLQNSDTIIFRNFIKRENIKVKIINLPAPEIIKLFESKKFNTGLDVIMLKSMTDVIDFHKKDILHPLNKGIHFMETEAKNSSEKFDYIGIGYDPFVVAIPKGHSVGIRMYNDLTRHKFSTNLSTSDLIPLFAPILSKKNKIESNNWMKKFFDHSKKDSLFNDSLAQFLPVLTTYSTYYSKDNRLEFKDKICIFPNTKSTGTFYNLRTICVANQAENFDASMTFIQYFVNDINNKALNKKLNTIAIHSNEVGFRKYYVNTETLAQYYVTIKRSTKKLEDHYSN